MGVHDVGHTSLLRSCGIFSIWNEHACRGDALEAFDTAIVIESIRKFWLRKKDSCLARAGSGSGSETLHLATFGIICNSDLADNVDRRVTVWPNCYWLGCTEPLKRRVVCTGWPVRREDRTSRYVIGVRRIARYVTTMGYPDGCGNDKKVEALKERQHRVHLRGYWWKEVHKGGSLGRKGETGLRKLSLCWHISGGLRRI